MSKTDPIADMLTRIRNGSTARHSTVEIPSSRMKIEIARLMTEQGYIVGYKTKQGEHGEVIIVELKYSKSRERVISGIKRVSKPGRRVYALSLIHISEPTRRTPISYAVFCLK